MDPLAGLPRLRKLSLLSRFTLSFVPTNRWLAIVTRTSLVPRFGCQCPVFTDEENRGPEWDLGTSAPLLPAGESRAGVEPSPLPPEPPLPRVPCPQCFCFSEEDPSGAQWSLPPPSRKSCPAHCLPAFSAWFRSPAGGSSVWPPVHLSVLPSFHEQLPGLSHGTHPLRVR